MSVSLHVSKLPHHLHYETLPYSNEYRSSWRRSSVPILKVGTNNVGKLTATAALLPREEPHPRLPVKTELLNGWQRGVTACL